jgi:hypothetical protein
MRAVCAAFFRTAGFAGVKQINDDILAITGSQAQTRSISMMARQAPKAVKHTA